MTTHPNLKVYSAGWCPDCQVAKRWLDAHGIPYEVVDIETIPEAAEELMAKTGRRGIPYFVLNDEWIRPYTPGRGFNSAEMSALFGVDRQSNL